MNKANILNTITLNKKVVAHRISDGSELISAEANTDFDSKIPISIKTGTTLLIAIAPLTAFTVS